ncbi:hypothetical protein S40288_10228 [Stachybotrys chartarum IBT 40288]|nr:hypothetical protein S40288_10228 [Stachybotrys chartarum IBT 40288]
MPTRRPARRPPPVVPPQSSSDGDAQTSSANVSGAESELDTSDVSTYTTQSTSRPAWIRQLRKPWERYGLHRFIPFIGYHHVMMFFATTFTVLLCKSIDVYRQASADLVALLLGACTSAGFMRRLDVKLVSFTYRDELPPNIPSLMMDPNLPAMMLNQSLQSGTARVREVQVGYFTSCARLDPGNWQCGLSRATVEGVDDPLRLLEAAQHLRTGTVTPGLIILCIILGLAYIVLLSTFPGWHEEEGSEGSERVVKPFPSRQVSVAALVCSSVGSFVLFVAVAWQHIAVASAATLLEGMRYGLVDVTVGIEAAVLAWLSVFLSCVCTIGLAVMVLSIRVLSQLVEGSEF